jgi:hypothetical protein
MQQWVETFAWILGVFGITKAKIGDVALIGAIKQIVGQVLIAE